MTIKKRLAISNIMMTAIPVVISLIIAVISIIIYAMIAYFYLPELEDTVLQIHYVLESSEKIYHVMNIVKWVILIIIPAVIIFVCVYTNWFLTRFITNKIMEPLDKITVGIEQIHDGNLDYRIEYDNKDEFSNVCDALNIMSSWLKETRIIAEKEEKSRKEAFAGISHDLRSPLTSIRAYTQALIDKVPQTEENVEMHLNTILSKELVIESMVNQLFLYSKMDLNDFPYNPVELSLVDEIETIVYENQTEDLSVTVSGDKDVAILGDPEQIRRIVLNIMENAKKYSGREDTALNITVKRKNSLAVIELCDNGKGAPEENLEMLFNTFFRGEKSRHNPDKGSGLGLSIVKKAVEQMNGTVSAENRNGLCIIITVPTITEK